MAFFTDIAAALEALRGVLGEEAEAVDVPAAVNNLADDALIGLIEQASVLVRAGESVRIAATGAVAARSTREAGHGGLAQKGGHRSAVSLIQDLTGTTRADAAKQVRLGEALTAGSASVPTPVDGAGVPVVGESVPVVDASAPLGTDAALSPPVRPWHAVLCDALMTGELTSAQHDAIYRGLGEPPTVSGDATAPAAATPSATCGHHPEDSTPPHSSGAGQDTSSEHLCI